MLVSKCEMRYPNASSFRQSQADSQRDCAFFGNKESHDDGSSSYVELSIDNEVIIDRLGDKSGFRPTL